ncbi:hypothetical protein C8Q74DRAFT_100307 [Fomes fomentarius]|nr:hypothetical protein C8Q74DRAFT_100307 [Fomes fomentarius]
MESGHMPSPARCNVCSQVFPSKNKASEHAKAMGHFPTDIVRICDECDATFASSADQGDHSVQTGHLKNSYTSALTSANTGKSFVCANCDTSYPNEGILAAHRLVVHKRTPEKQECLQSGRAIALDRTHEATYNCPICQAKFQTNIELIDHLMHTSSCNECKICLPPWQDLEDHYWDSAMHPKCKPCALVFKNNTEWSAHKQVCPIAPRGAAEGPQKTQRPLANTRLRPSGQSSARAGPSGSRSGQSSSRGGQGSRAGYSSASSGLSASSKMQRSPPHKPPTPSTSVEGTSSDSPPVSTSSGSFAGNASSGLSDAAKMPPVPKAGTGSARTHTSTDHNTASLESHRNAASALNTVVEAPTTALPPPNVFMASPPQNSQPHRQNFLSPSVGSQLSSISASKGKAPILELPTDSERGGAHGLKKPLAATSFPSGDSLLKPNAPPPVLAGPPISVQRTTSKSLRVISLMASCMQFNNMY